MADVLEVLCLFSIGSKKRDSAGISDFSLLWGASI